GDAETFTLRWYPAADCSGSANPMGSGPGTTGVVGAMTRHTAATLGFQLTAGERTSNCATATWQAPPGPDPLVLSAPVAITRPNDPGQPGAVVTWPEVTATGGVAPVTIACTHESG